MWSVSRLWRPRQSNPYRRHAIGSCRFKTEGPQQKCLRRDMVQRQNRITQCEQRPSDSYLESDNVRSSSSCSMRGCKHVMCVRKWVFLLWYLSSKIIRAHTCILRASCMIMLLVLAIGTIYKKSAVWNPCTSSASRGGADGCGEAADGDGSDDGAAFRSRIPLYSLKA